MNEILFAYYLAPLNGGGGRFFIYYRSRFYIVEELPKLDRKWPGFEKKWSKGYDFMVLPGFSAF